MEDIRGDVGGLGAHANSVLTLAGLRLTIAAAISFGRSLPRAEPTEPDEAKPAEHAEPLAKAIVVGERGA